MINIKSAREIEKLRQGGEILARILDEVIKKVEPGVSTQELNNAAESLMQQHKVKPSFKNYQGYPAVLCTSVNNQVVHSIPKADAVLKERDIISLDAGIWYGGLCTDMSRTVGVGKISIKSQHLINITEQALDKGIESVKPSATVGDISAAIQTFVESYGYGVVRTLFGHGVGREVHEEPRIPNFGQPNSGPKLRAGMVIAIEPMVTIGDYKVQTEADGWSISTVDGSLSAHFEDTIVVTESGHEVITRL